MDAEELILKANDASIRGHYDTAETLLLNWLAGKVTREERLMGMGALAALYRDTGSWSVASNLYRNLAYEVCVGEGDPATEFQLLLEAVWCQLLLERITEADAIFDSASQLVREVSSRDLALFHALRAYRSILVQDLHEAQEQSEKANSLSPDPWTYVLLLTIGGMVCWTIGMENNARDSIEQASEALQRVSILRGNLTLQYPLMRTKQLMHLA